jgi:cytochrome c556
MRKYLAIAITSVLAVLLGSCASQQSQQAAATSQPEYNTTATIKDIMDSIVDPGADAIWGAVETVVSAKGVEEKMPRTDEEWKEVRRKAIMLLEATNLLQIPGRHVAKPGEKADDPKVELAPEQIEAMINKDRAQWAKFAQALHEATMLSFKAIEAKNAEELLNTGDRIDTACENCHKQYWYPDEKPPEAASTQKSGN